MKILAPVLALVFAANAHAAGTRSIPLNEVPEAVVKNLGNACAAASLSQGSLVLDVKSQALDAVYAIPCQGMGKATGYIVYVVTANGKFDYLSFDRKEGLNTYYIPQPELTIESDGVHVSFEAATPACQKNEIGNYRVVDHSNILWTNFQTESVAHTCMN